MAEKKERRILSRWGNPIADDHGFVDIPGWILRNYHKCGVSPLEMMFIAHVMAFKYDTEVGKPENAAKPSLTTIATYMGRDVKNVRRLKQGLIKKNLLKIVEHKGDCDEYNFAGLTNRCLQYALEEAGGQETNRTPGDSVTPPKSVPSTPPKNVPPPLPKMGAEDSEEDSEDKIENQKNPKPPLGLESRDPIADCENPKIKIGISTVDLDSAAATPPKVPPKGSSLVPATEPAPLPLELQLILFAILRVAGLDFRLVPGVLTAAHGYYANGYIAEDVAAAKEICAGSDWRWTDKTHGNTSRVMALEDLTRYIGYTKVQANEFKYVPEMQLMEVISRVREAGDMAAIDAGWVPAPPELEAEIEEQGVSNG